MGQQYLSTDPNAGDPLKGPAGPSLLEQMYHPGSGPEAPPDDLLTRLGRMLEPMAHPQTMNDFGHLLMAPVDVTRGSMMSSLLHMIRNRLPSRQTVGSAMEGTGRTLQHPIQAPGKALESLGTKIKGSVPDPLTPAPKPRPGSFEDFFTADPTRRTQIQEAREAYRLKPRGTPTASPRGTPSAAPPASAPPGSAPAASMRLNPEESQYLQQLIAEGYDETDVLQAIARVRQEGGLAPSVTPPAAPTASLPRGFQTPSEVQEFERLLKAGQSRTDAMQMIVKLRQMQQGYRLPTTEQAQRAVLDRNVTGRWPE